MSKIELRDQIDFGCDSIPKLFRKILIPTLWGMFFTGLFIVTDGIFVGKGLGNEALASVGIVAPFYNLAGSIGLMLGMGGSIVASIHLANKKLKSSRIIVTQAALTAVISLAIISVLALIFIDEWVMAIGAAEELVGPSKAYAFGFIPFLPVCVLTSCLPFFIRLDGSPKYAMMCSIVGALLNIVLDYLFIFVFDLGLFGAAIATSTGSTISALMALFYLMNKKKELSFVKIKWSKKSIFMSLRNIWYMSKLGFASFLGQGAAVVMVICGNIVFSRVHGTAGVAAFSVCGYVFPLIFMIYSAIAQASQPIISFNYALGDRQRVARACRVSMSWGVAIGSVLTLGMALFAPQLSSMFLDPGSDAHRIATEGLPLFAIGLISFAVNIMTIGYYQSLEKISKAVLLIALRGFVYMILFFILMPNLASVSGAWLAVPAAEFATNISILLIIFYSKRKLRRIV